jgi:Sulfotransferase family
VSELDAPILIAGDGRSGTTLLSLVLDSNPGLCVGPELHFRGPENLGPYILDMLDLRDATPDDDQWFALRKDPELYNGVHFVNRCDRFGVSSAELRGRVVATMRECASELSLFEDRCELIKRLGAYRLQQTGASSWGFKIMRDIRVAKWYSGVWPAARYVFIVRDGRDVAASQLIEHSGWGYAEAEAAAQGWVDLIQWAKVAAESYPIHILRYESLIASPREALTRLCEFLAVEFDEAMMSHASQSHTLYDNPHAHPSIGSVTRPLNDSSVGRYRRDLSIEQIRAFEAIAGEVLTEFAYEVGAS